MFTVTRKTVREAARRYGTASVELLLGGKPVRLHQIIVLIDNDAEDFTFFGLKPGEENQQGMTDETPYPIAYRVALKGGVYLGDIIPLKDYQQILAAK